MMVDNIDCDTSLEPAPLRELSEDQKARLTEQLDRYLCGLEQGEPIDASVITAEHPDLADVFSLYLEKLDSLYGVAVGFAAAPKPNSESMTLGDFTIVREIGRGGMGVVYEATQRSLNRRVAIKLLPMASLLDSRQIARFKNEAHAAGLLQHPNIVPVHSVGTDRGMHYYAMQYIDGESIEQWVSEQVAASANFDDTGRHFEVDAKQVTEWAIDVAEALHAAHETGVVHRDVKPSNLMLDKQGKIWITDFGLARCQTEVSLTQSGDLIGTMRYMSPEQARGQLALVDGRSDIYSLAATLYEMLTLQPAHQGGDAPTLLKMIDEREVTPLRQLRGDLPRDLETVIAKAMSKGRDGRYETAEAFADDLRRVVEGEPTFARPPTVTDRISRWASKHRQGVLVSILAVALGFVGLAVSTATIAAKNQIIASSALRNERAEKLSRGAVDRLGSQMAELLADIPAAGPVRRQLLSETLDYYQTFAKQAGNDPELREDLAITYGKIGNFQSELGQNEAAVDSLVRSEQLYADLVAVHPDNAQMQLDWSTSQNNLAQSLQTSGRLEEAARYFAKAIVTQKQLMKSDQLVRRPLATTLNNLGLLLAQTEAIAEAERTYLEAIALLDNATTNANVTEPMYDTRHLDAPVLEDFATTANILTNLAGLLAQHAPDRAVRYARQALTQQTKALESDRRNTKLATQAIVTLNTLGSAQSRNQQNDASIDTFHRAIEIGEQLLAWWPEQPTYRRDLVISLNHLGLSLSKSGKLAEARSAFEQALAHERPLAESFAGDAETQSMLGGVLNNFGFLQQQLGDIDGAAESYRQAINAQSTAVRLAPEVGRYQEYLRKHEENFAAAVKGAAS
ncbi:Serine/threonine-protein kinase PrkC [Planctomycetes bacterium CA13]|uniref:Serine/threonine-protein kinase PrkC n=1 Tax=Novipirellula herctigrandis TaxID=2527986 RepID=A0A5C5YWV6_9BACT|nr:Serine/threonine-protein kinase PrkC [Planctomycetes bacterium CA13]